MIRHLTRELIVDQGIIGKSPNSTDEDDRGLVLIKWLYIATVALYLGFLVVMASGLSVSGPIVGVAIFALAIVAGLGLRAVWGEWRWITVYGT